jgi:hypothetical protein
MREAEVEQGAIPHFLGSCARRPLEDLRRACERISAEQRRAEVVQRLLALVAAGDEAPILGGSLRVALRAIMRGGFLRAGSVEKCG